MAKTRPRRSICRSGRRPKGSYPVPAGGTMLPPTSHDGIKVQGLLRDEPDVEALARLVLDIAREMQRELTDAPDEP